MRSLTILSEDLGPKVPNVYVNVRTVPQGGHIGQDVWDFLSLPDTSSPCTLSSCYEVHGGVFQGPQNEHEEVDQCGLSHLHYPHYSLQVVGSYWHQVG